MSHAHITFSPIPETQVIKFVEIHGKDAAKIKANEEKESAFNALKGTISKMGKLLNLKKENDDIEVSYIDCFYRSYWCADASRITKYECEKEYTIDVKDTNVKQLRINTGESEFVKSVEYGVAKFSVIEDCERKNDFYNIIDNETAYFDNDFQRQYIDNKDYRKRKFSAESDKILKPELSKTALIQRINAALITEIRANTILEDNLQYNKIELYLVPIHYFECYKKSTQEKVLLKINALTGKVIRDNNSLKDVLANDDVKAVIIDVAAEVASAAIPGSGPIIKYAMK